MLTIFTHISFRVNQNFVVYLVFHATPTMDNSPSVPYCSGNQIINLEERPYFNLLPVWKKTRLYGYIYRFIKSNIHVIGNNTAHFGSLPPELSAIGVRKRKRGDHRTTIK